MLDNPIHSIDIIRNLNSNGMGETWGYSKLIDEIKNEHIDGLTFLNNDNLAIAIDNFKDTIDYKSINLHYVKLLPGTYDSLVELLSKYSVSFDVFIDNVKNKNNFLDMLSQSFFTIGIYSLILFAVNLFFRNNPATRNQMGGPGASGPFADYGNLFRNTQTKKYPPNLTRFEDVAGCDEAKFELTEIVDFLKNPVKYQVAGAKIPKGVLLEGPPGTGKTLLAKAVSGEAEVPFLSASGSEFIEMFVGVGASRVRSLFDKAAELSPCVVFIDEIDAVGRKRGAGIAGGNDEREQTLNEILTRMDGFDTVQGIIVIAATNRIDILDDALIRPGRFDRKVSVTLPDYNGRKEISKVHFKDKYTSDDFNYDQIASLTNGFSGADLANLANEAAILSVRYNQTNIDNNILFDAYEKITLGLTSYNQDNNKQITELITYHEVGHGLLVYLFKEFFDLRKITINSNKSGAGGYTLFTPTEFFSKYPTKKFLLAQLVVALGGRSAEVYLSRKKYDPENVNNQIFEDYNDLDITTGATNDLEQAFNLAKLFITRFGFSEHFKIDINDKSLPFLGEQMGKNIKNDGCVGLNSEINYLIQYAFDKSYDLLLNNEDNFINIVQLLKEKRIINLNDIENIWQE